MTYHRETEFHSPSVPSVVSVRTEDGTDGQTELADCVSEVSVKK